VDSENVFASLNLCAQITSKIQNLLYKDLKGTKKRAYVFYEI